MSDELSDLVRRVADATCERDMENEDWEKGTAINGLLTLTDERYVDTARELVDRAIDTQTADGKFNYDDPKSWLPGDDPHRAQCEPATIGYGALEFYERTGDDRYLDACRRQFQYLTSKAQRTEDGGIAYSTGPIGLWVDSIYMICPFFARYGQVTDSPEAFDEAVSHVEIQSKYLQDPHTGLFRHEWRETPNTYPESSLWARGNGWAAAGIVETLRHLPKEHGGREALVDVLDDQVSTLLELQDESGFWHHILDYPDTPLETSSTLQFAYTFSEGADLDVLGEEYIRAGERAFDVCKGTVDREGDVRRVAIPPGGPDVPLGTTSYGQGWFLLAADSVV